MCFVGALNLVGLGDVISRLIEELSDQAVKFLLAIQFHGGIRQSPRSQILAQLIFGKNQRPQNLAEMHSLGEAALSEVGIPSLNGKVCLLEQPSPEIVVDLVNMGIQFVE